MRAGLVLALALAAAAPSMSSSLPGPGTRATAADDNKPSSLLLDSSNNSRLSTVLPWLQWFRDGAVGLVWSYHPDPPAPPPRELPIYPLDPDMVVVRLEVASPEEEEELSKAIARLGMDVWAVGDYYADIRLTRDRIHTLMAWLPAQMHQAWQLLIPDMPRAIGDVLHCSACAVEAEAESMQESSRSWEDTFFDTYQPLAAVNKWMDLMATMFPSFVSNVYIGQSYEGRPINGLRISTSSDDRQLDNNNNNNNNNAPRKMMVLVGGMHAREWISTTTVNYVSWSLISSLLSRDGIIADFLDEFEVVLIPALNPDGIEYSWETNRLWRKTRQPSGPYSRCQGFDLDHAFEYGWDGGNRHNHACSDSFGGAYGPFEPAEARALANWARNVTAAGSGRRIVSVLDLHSYSQQILYPMAASCDEPPNLENLEELAFGMAKTIRQTRGQRYDVMPACEGLTSQRAEPGTRRARPSLVEYGGGSMVDWFFHYMGAHYSYQLKLPDTGSYGFLLPKEHIRPTGREIFNAVRYMADYMMGNNGIEKVYRPPRKNKGRPVEEAEEPVERLEHHELRRRDL